MASLFAAAVISAISVFPCEDGEVLVGVTGYGESPEYRELQTNDECNLWVQWTKSENLFPKYLGDEWCEWAKKNRIRVMTIYGDQDAKRTKELRDFWGDLYLGNNLGEYAGFLYQDEKSNFKSWPRLNNLKEAHDWLTGSMLAKPKRDQLSRPKDGQEPFLFSTSGSPLACYELEGGIDLICNEMYAVGCGNLAYATAEARGAARRHGRNWWSAWLAHEWQTCWPRVPYGVKQKYDSLEVGLKEMWLMGTSMMVLESGSQTTQAQDYTPPDGSMKEFKTPKQFYNDPVPIAYRKTMKEFYQWTKAHPRAKGAPETTAALVLGNYDGFVGMTFDTFAIFGQHHLAATNSNWRCGAPENTWILTMDTFFPRPLDSMKPFANGWLGGTPHGQLDVVNVDDNLKTEELKRYRILVFGGWNTMTPNIAGRLREYVADGGEVVLSVPQLSSRIDREFTDYTAVDLVQAVPGVTVKDPIVSEDILMTSAAAPGFLKKAYPAHLSAKFRLAEAELDSEAEAVVTMGKKPYLVRRKFGKGAYWLVLGWDFPSVNRRTEEFWKTLIVGLVEGKQDLSIQGADRDYINWCAYFDRIYMLNTDCVSPRTIIFRGEELRFEPKELKELKK